MGKDLGNVRVNCDLSIQPTKPDFITHLPRLTELVSLPSLGETHQRAQLSPGETRVNSIAHTIVLDWATGQSANPDPSSLNSLNVLREGTEKRP